MIRKTKIHNIICPPNKLTSIVLDPREHSGNFVNMNYKSSSTNLSQVYPLVVEKKAVPFYSTLHFN